MNKQDFYILSIDQSTQGTKALLLDARGRLVMRTDCPHRQIVNAQGWVSHDPEEIYQNTKKAAGALLARSGVGAEQLAGIGISNQRETTVLWERRSGKPLEHAVVWQCGRASGIAERIAQTGCGEEIQRLSGMPLSPYFPAAKMAWLLERGAERADRAQRGELCLGTIDSWLIFRLTEGRVFATDYSNASRTQLFNLDTLAWDRRLCGLFGIPLRALPQVRDSDAVFGYTTMDGLLSRPVPICGVLGDSHGALFGQGCLSPGMLKATYGTGSSLMMNIGEQPIRSSHGIVTSLAWSMGGKVNYVLEGNLNYTGAVISWLKNDLKLIASAGETEELAFGANPGDKTYLVPAFTGLGAPYWDARACAAVRGITRVTGRAELVRAALDCIAYQITDLLRAMEQDTGLQIRELRADGGPSKNRYLMQFQSDIADTRVRVPDAEELSGIGAAFMAGIAAGLYQKEQAGAGLDGKVYLPAMEERERAKKYAGWKQAVESVLTG